MTKLYTDLAADWYQLLTPLSEYEDEANLFHKIFQERNLSPSTILELGAGAGHNAYFMKRWYDMTLTDIAVDMLAISKKINPDCEHHSGDMKTLRLNKTFDAVFIHDAIMYMITEDQLEAALLTAFVHCRDGGTVLVSPDAIKDNFEGGTDSGGSDDGKRGLRYLEWKYDPDPNDSTYIVDYAYLLRSPEGRVQVIHDRHVEGLFSEVTWLALLKKTGFDAYAIPDPEFNRTNFIGYK